MAFKLDGITIGGDTDALIINGQLINKLYEDGQLVWEWSNIRWIPASTYSGYGGYKRRLTVDDHTMRYVNEGTWVGEGVIDMDSFGKFSGGITLDGYSNMTASKSTEQSHVEAIQHNGARSVRALTRTNQSWSEGPWISLGADGKWEDAISKPDTTPKGIIGYPDGTFNLYVLDFDDGDVILVTTNKRV